MASDLQTFPVALPGGINQSAPAPREVDLEELKNFAIFRDRIGLRAPLTLTATLQDDQVTPQDVTSILDITEHAGKMFVASYSSNTNKVYLHSLQVDGTGVTQEATLWSSVSSKPVVTLTSVDGGTATATEQRLYAADYNQNHDTVYWDGTSVTTVSEDLDNDSSKENISFSLMETYKFRVWGTQFFEGTTQRAEMIRYSRPGLIASTDDAGGSNPKEWHSASFESIGRRGDPIVALSKTGDRLLIFQERSLNVLYGSTPQNFTIQEISDVVGAVGPHAVTSVDNRVAYFWANDGPYRTDGTQLEYLGGPIRQLAVEVDAEELNTRVGYSPDDGLVYFIVSPGGADRYELALTFDTRRDRWMKAEWLVGASTTAEFGAVAFLDDVTSPAPEAAPSGLTATATSDSTIDLDWTNGDVNVNTETHVYRSTSAAFTPSDGSNRVAVLSAGVNEYTDTSLSEQTQYYYQLRHFRNAQHSGASNEDSDTTWLSEPSAISLRGLTSGIEISGTNNASGADIEIERSTDGSTWSNVTTLAAPGGSFSYGDTGLTCGTTYFYRVKASKTAETDSTYTATESHAACDATSTPTAPSGLGATASGETQIDLSWTDNSDDEDGFEIHRSTDGGSTYSLLASIAAESTSYSDTGLSSDTTYYYKVKAVNDEGDSAFASAVSATTGKNLDAPTSVSATVVSSSQIDLTWTENADDETGIEVWVDAGSGFTLPSGHTLSANSTSFSDTGLSEGTEYSYKIRAVGGGDDGPFSSVVSATTDVDPPAAPTSLTATKDATNPETEIDLSWTDNATNETSYKVYRKSGGGGYTAIATGLAAGTASYTDTGLTSNTTYTYKVAAVNSGGETDSNEASETTDAFTSTPTAPSALGATTQSVDQIDLSWTDNSSGSGQEDEFIIYRCTGSKSACDWPGEYTQIATVGSDVTSYSDTGLTDNTTYSYVVTAKNTAGESSGSNEAQATTDPSAPTAPSGTSVSTLSTSSLRITWADNSDDETGFDVYRAASSGATYTKVADVAADTTTYDDTVLQDNSDYFYKVLAHNAGGNSAFSAEASGTTNLDAPSSLSAAGVSTTQIDVSWSLTGVTDEDNIEVYRSTDGGSTYSLQATLAANTTSYSDTGLDSGTQYHYKVRATISSPDTGSGQSANSAFTAAVSANTDNETTVPADPTGFTATPDDQDDDASSSTSTGVEVNAVDLAWTDNADNEDNYIVERRINGETTWNTIATLPAGSTSYRDETVSPDTAYDYRLHATNSQGDSAKLTDLNNTVEPLCTPQNIDYEDTSFCDIITPHAEITVWWDLGDVDDLGIVKIQRETNGDGNWINIKEWDTGVGDDPVNDPSVDSSGGEHNGQYFYEDTDVNFSDTFAYRVVSVFSGSENVGTFTSADLGGIPCTEPTC